MRFVTGGRSTLYFFLLWVVPVGTSFMFFMLLRDIYQHTNADDGRFTHSRVFFCDPLTQWAVFVHGQGLHIPHHLFPAVPHYRLGELHDLLKRRHVNYSEQVVECHGTFSNEGGYPTVLDVLTAPKSAADFARVKALREEEGSQASRASWLPSIARADRLSADPPPPAG